MRKKYHLVLPFFIVMITSATAMKKEKKTFDYCDPSKIMYRIGTLFGRNDFLYLAYTNSTWFLQKKIALKENISDLDRYYKKCCININQQSIIPCYTPLHAAIIEGHVESIKLLLHAGADKNKKILLNATSRDMANESKLLPYVCCEIFGKDDIHVNIQKEWHSVGLTAIDLAEKFMKKDDSWSAVSKDQRKAIYELLKN